MNMYQSEKIVVASREGIILDSNVYTGGGTDQTEKIQAVLDRAKAPGGLHLIIDGAALISGIDIHSNTTLECLNKDCGFFLADQSNCAVITNADWDFEEIKNRNITLLGGTYNQNCKNQLHHVPNSDKPHFNVFGIDKFVVALEFYGVENLCIKDISIRNQRTFAMLAANWKNIDMENIAIELPDRMHAQNQDGLHFWGPGRFLNLRNIRGCAGDDFIALAPDEYDDVSSITDVIIDGVFLDDADQGIRMLSRNKGRLDRVIVRNVTGTYRSYGFYINPWFPSDSYGNFGNIIFENIDLRQTAPNYDYTPPFLFRIGGNIESITFRNIYHHNPSDNRTLFEIGRSFYDETYVNTKGEKPVIKSVLIDGLHIVENRASADCEYIKLMCPIKHMVIRNVEVIRENTTEPKGCMIKTKEGCEVDTLILNNIYACEMECFIKADQGIINTIHIYNSLCNNVTKGIIAQEGTKINNLQIV